MQVEVSCAARVWLCAVKTILKAGTCLEENRRLEECLLFAIGLELIGHFVEEPVNIAAVGALPAGLGEKGEPRCR
jgi:hypothetical protein